MKKGLRNYCGIDFPDGLIQNQKLNEPVVTPTTKDANDQPITPEEVYFFLLLSPHNSPLPPWPLLLPRRWSLG